MKNDSQFAVLIERHLKFQKSQDGDSVDIIVQVGCPHWTEPNVAAACPVSFVGGIGRVQDICGIDPLNAMKNAISFIELYLSLSSSDEKGKFFWEGGEEYDGG